MKKLVCVVTFLFASSVIDCTQNDILNYLQIDFYKSMSHLERFKIGYAEKNSSWIQAKKLYEDYVFNNLEYSKKPRIPKIIHQIWLGSSFPQVYKKWQQSWLKEHPDWEYKLWTDTDIDNLNLKNQDLYNNAKNYGEKSDILRYEILYRFGGLYVDTDFECLKPFDIFHHICDFYAGALAAPHLWSNNALIGTKPGHPILKRCIDNLNQNVQKYKETLQKSGPGFFSRCILKEIFNESVGRAILFPASYFYPWPWYKRDPKSCTMRRSFIKPESFAIHHWEVSWQK